MRMNFIFHMIPWYDSLIYIICKIRKVLYSERCPRLLEDFLQNFNETLNWSNLDFSYSLISNQLGRYIFPRGFNKINSQEYATSILRKNLLPRFNVVLRDKRSSTSSAITKQISRTNLKTTKLDRVSETRLDSENQPSRTLALLRAESWKSLRALARCLQDYKNARYTREHARTTYHVRKATVRKSLRIVLCSCRHSCGKGFYDISLVRREFIKETNK